MLNASAALIDSIGWALLHFVWQGAIGGVLAALMLVAMRRCSASARYVAALLALVAIAALPIATVLWLSSSPTVELPTPVVPQVAQEASPESMTATVTEGTEVVPNVPRDEARSQVDESLPIANAFPTPVMNPVERATPARTVEVSWWESLKTICASRLEWIVEGWLLGVAVLSLRLLVGWLRVRRLTQRAAQPASEALQTLLARLMERLTMTRPVRLVESMLVEVPTVIGWLKPVILLPATALSGLSTEQLEALLAHELAHVRRNDYLINLLQTLVETLLFYHPAVWWLSRRIRIEREHCCDDLAVQVCGDELSYAKALVALEELRGPTIKLAMSADGGSLLGRVARLLKSKSSSKPSPSFGLPILSLSLVGVMALATAHESWALLSVDSQAEFGLDQAAETEGVAPQDDVAQPSDLPNDTPMTKADDGVADVTPLPSAASLIDSIKDSAKKLATGRMRVEFERVTDLSWTSGKLDQPPVKTVGTSTWRSDGQQWRVDYDGELPNSGAAGRVTNFPNLWTSGFDGERFYDFDRDAKSLAIGTTDSAAKTYEPANLFWNPTNGGLESVLEVLRKPDVTVTEAKLGGLEGYRVERVVERNGQWRWSAFVCPSRSYLTLELQQFLNDRLSWECKLSDLREVQAGVWYPQTIHRASYNWSNDGKRSLAWQHDFKVTELALGVEEARSWPTPAERAAGFAHPTSKVPYGIHIHDLPRGLSYFNDPWWPQLEPILKQKHGWPKTSLLPFEDVKSHFEKVPTATFRFQSGGTVPKFETKEGSSLVWTAGPDKDAPAAKVTLVLFWAPWDERSVKTLVAAKRLHAELSPHGLQIVAVQDAVRAAEAPSAFMKALALPFPSLVDEFSEVEGDLGKNTIRKTLGVRGMPSGCLLDHEHRVIAITDAKKLTAQIAELLTAAGAKDVPVLKMDEPLTDEIGRAAEAEWKELVAKSSVRTQIKGRVVNAQNGPMAEVVVEVEPRLKLARGGYGGLTVYPDFKATRTLRTNANGEFEAESLPKGSYEVRIRADGYAVRRFDVVVGPVQPGELGEIKLDQPDRISGRVVDDNRQPIKAARVEVRVRHPDLNNLAITTRSPGAMPKTVTADDGSFVLDKLEAGHFTLEVDAVGHERAVIETVPLGKTDLKVWLDKYPEPLQRKVSLHYENAPLREVLSYIRQAAQLTIDLDVNELKKLDINETQTVINVSVDDSCVGDALEKMFEPLEVVGFAWDGKRVFISTREIASKHRMPPFETIKGPPRERYAQKAVEIALQELEIAKKANLRVPGTIPEFEIKRLQLQVDAVRAEHELVLHEASHVFGQSITPEFMKKSTELLIKRVETFLALNKTLLEIANAENQKKPGSVKEQELQRLKKQIEDLEKDLARLTGKPQASAPFINPQGAIRAASG